MQPNLRIKLFLLFTNYFSKVVMMDTEKIDTVYHKATDFWGKHNITTRTVVMVTLFLLAGTVIAGWLNVKMNYFEVILDRLTETVLWLTIIIIAGVNGASVIMDKLVQYKSK